MARFRSWLISHCHLCSFLVLVTPVLQAAFGIVFISISLLAQPPAAVVSDAVRAEQFAALARDAQEIERAFSVLKRCSALVKPSVVHIEADKADASGRIRKGAEEAGSGFVLEINKKIVVITNCHVVRESAVKNIHIKLFDGRTVAPRAMACDVGTDIAVLEMADEKLIPGKIGDSDIVDSADLVLAIGSPFGLSQSVTMGIISAKGRRDLDLSKDVDIQDFLQTDAAINPGNSGGPLVNLRGEIIGMNTAIASQSGGGEGIGFAIPSNIVLNVAKQLVEHGHVSRAYLGVTLDHSFNIQTATRLGLPAPKGAHILGVTAKSPAEEAKLQLDDVIVEINGVPIENDTHLISVIGLAEIGRQVPLKVLRKQEVFTVNVQLSAKSKFEAAK